MKKKLFTVLVLSCLSAVIFSGCTVDGKQVFISALPEVGQVFKIGRLGCDKKTAKVYLANYRNIYGTAGQINLWGESLNTDRLQENIDEACLHRLSMVYALDVYASENDIKLTSQEKDLVEKAASDYMDTLSAADKKSLGVNKDDIAQMYDKEALASKVYKQIVSKTDDEVSDDEARVMDAIIITLPADADEKADKAEAELDQGKDIMVVAKKYSTEKKITVSMDKKNWPKEVTTPAFELEKGEYSVPIKSGSCTYIVYCVSKYDEEKSEENRQQIIDERKQKMIESIIKKQNLKDYSNFDKNTWKTVTDSIDQNVTTDSFFETLSDSIAF